LKGRRFLPIVAVIFFLPNPCLQAEITIVPDRLKVDGLIQVYALFWQGINSTGWVTTGFEFQKRLAVFGLTGELLKGVSARMEFDFSRLYLRDLFVDFRWENGMALRLGQFKTPLNFESETREQDLRVEDYSLLYTDVLKPGDIRDIGLSLSYAPPCPGKFDYRLYGTVVNGTGPNSGDNNGWKDVSCRVIGKPFAEYDIWIGSSGYYGWVYPEAVRWLGVAGEVQLKQRGFSSQLELIYRRFQNRVTLAGLVEGSYDFGFFVPGTRLELIARDNGKFQGRGLAALGLDVVEGRLKVLLGYQYHTLLGDWGYQGVIAQLQAML